MRITSRGSVVLGSGNPPAAAVAAEHPVAIAGRLLVRYGLVAVIAWIGALKYGTYEAAAIQPLIAHSPLLSWLYHIFSVRALGAARPQARPALGAGAPARLSEDRRPG